MAANPRTLDVLSDVGVERERQEHLRRQGRFAYTCADPAVPNAAKFVILVEEIGEVAKETLTQPGDALAFDSTGSQAGLYRELIHVAAVAVAWAESL